MTTGTDGGDAVIDALAAAGADYVFSSPGSEWAPVWESIARRHRDGLPCPSYIDLTHETVAVGMATGYGLVTRRGQGVLLHAGPGLLQGSVAIHGALLAGVPMVVASSESTTYGDGPGPDPGGQWYRNLSVVGGPHVLAAPFTKWANQAASVHTLPTMVTRAMELASRAPAGPVYLNIPLEVLLDPWESEPVHPVAPRGATVSSPADIAAVAELIRGATNPVIVTETVGREEGGMDALVDFATAFGIPVVEPNSAVCANFPRDHVLHAGGDLEPWVDAADLILLVNCRAPFYPPSRKPARARIVVIDDVPQRPHIVYQVLRADAYLEGSVPATLRELAAQAGPAPTRPGVADHHAIELAAVRAAESRALSAEAIDPVRVVAALRELADDAVYVDETITHSRVVQRHLRLSRPDTYFYVQGGLGQGIAVALGVKLAVPDRPVVLTIGDGAFLYNPVIPSLSAARENGLPLLIVVFNNHEYRSMKMNHLRFYPQGAAVQTGEFLGNDLSGQPSLSSFAEPFGMHGETVTTAAELAPALDRALKSVRTGTTAIVDVHVSR
ncbi:thiamine pyrophosphate-dependent enzyme [Paractinoplanes toevensis]|uniref:Benzoylformate decarboxylase n=1 Tax=Paractinoplanes toevensis TaxID=571911 RepID=A0A919VYN3_9ACTN|nr:thiamine pyrophosphate-dependent enzyme [Actinoplanes toevensis]GIM89207.1 benzoylformate decarboxylase [Actinoplanes toevensis]